MKIIQFELSFIKYEPININIESIFPFRVPRNRAYPLQFNRNRFLCNIDGAYNVQLNLLYVNYWSSVSSPFLRPVPFHLCRQRSTTWQFNYCAYRMLEIFNSYDMREMVQFTDNRIHSLINKFWEIASMIECINNWLWFSSKDEHPSLIVFDLFLMLNWL